ncbi:MAG: sulfatase [Acidobacteria bacterium]|nr:sulfatase [Acidobacteriota bacterium]
MQRRTFLSSLTGAALAARTAAPPPNFVFILADDFGWRDLACYGNQYFSTPNLDRLASQGARFTNAYAACPVCSPTRASILTGKYPVHTGVTDWIPGRPSYEKGPIITPRTATELKLSEVTMAERLKPAGYRSASVGKWHLGGQGFSPTDQGFDVNIGGNQSGSPPRSPKPYFGPWDLPNLPGAPGDFLTERLAQAASGFIRQNSANPFLVYLPHYSVHIPLGAREVDVARHKEKAQGRYNPTYAAMVESLDQSVGLVLDAIDQAGVADRTMVMFFGDNGGLRYEGKSTQAVTDNAPLRAGKGHLYEGGIREPLIVRYPRLLKAGAVIDTPVSSVDFLPTFCQAAGVAPGEVDGVSLMPLLGGGKLKPRPLFWHYPHYSNQGGEPGSAIREGRWKLIEFHQGGRRELFDLDQDPGETRNLISKEPAVARKRAATLDAWRKKSGAVMPQKNPNADPAWPGWGLTGEEKPTPPAS